MAEKCSTQCATVMDDQNAQQDGKIYQICIPNTQHDYFDYIVDAPVVLAIGTCVSVPFRNQTRLGFVVGRARPSVLRKLKSITAIVDNAPLFSERMLNLYQWVATYYQAPLSTVLSLALPKPVRTGKSTAKKNNTHQPCLDFSEAHTTSSPLPLNDEQARAVEAISKALHQYHCFLLQGITGSGKTEVYLQVVANVLEQGKQALILVPEIGLTPQLLSRFRERFSLPMAVVHSNLNDRERLLAWQQAKDGVAKLVIGTRSALFTPMPTLGLIIIDEEHDTSFKQMEGVRYSARDTALVRAQMEGVPIVLGSATPSLESLYNGHQSKYSVLRLDQKALSKTPLHYEVMDIRSRPLQHGLAQQTLSRIREHLQKNDQVMVFINRRGFAPVLLCHDCGWMADCQACDSHLTLHRQWGRLVCHHCGLTQPIPYQCPVCQCQTLLPIGAGTQRIHEFLSECFPKTSLLRVDRDGVRRKNALHEQLERIHRGEVQLMIGTQMLAKGHHFPRLGLVVVVDADAGFCHQDFRALERLGQLLTQVAGRAGREDIAGNVLIQTHFPHHPLLNRLIQQGYDAFAEALLRQRQEADLPPYRFLALIRARDKSAEKVLNFLHLVREQLLLHALTLLGPAPAPLARKANEYQMQLLIKASSRKELQCRLAQLKAWLVTQKRSHAVRWHVDVDPVDLS